MPLYYDPSFFNCLYKYEFMSLCFYNKSTQAQKSLLRLWNNHFINEQKDKSTIETEELLLIILNYNNLFYVKENENGDKKITKLLDDRKYTYYYDDGLKNLEIDKIYKEKIDNTEIKIKIDKNNNHNYNKNKINNNIIKMEEILNKVDENITDDVYDLISLYEKEKNVKYINKIIEITFSKK